MADKKCPECKKGAPEYMNTYGDMMTLLLCFFVLLFAMSSVDSQKFKTVMQAFQGALGVMKGGQTVDPTKLVSNTRVTSKGTEMKFRLLAKNIQSALDEIEKEKNKKSAGDTDKTQNEKDDTKSANNEMVTKVDLEKNATVVINEKGIKISLGSQMLFDSGRAELKPEAMILIDSIMKEVRGVDNQIIVEGHTDNIPINTQRFPSNWELSTTRAVNVLKHMIEKDKTLIGRIAVAGYAETKPEASNETAQGRQKNRRVDILILKTTEEIIQEKLEE